MPEDVAAAKRSLKTLSAAAPIFFATAACCATTARIFDWMPPFIMVTGIVGWVSDAVGVALIIVGAVGSAVMRKVFPAKTEATERQ